MPSLFFLFLFFWPQRSPLPLLLTCISSVSVVVWQWVSVQYLSAPPPPRCMVICSYIMIRIYYIEEHIPLSSIASRMQIAEQHSEGILTKVLSLRLPLQ